MRFQKLLVVAIVLSLLAIGSQTIFAQDNNDKTCEKLAKDIIRKELAKNCAGLADDEILANNSICYGYQTLETLFEDEQGTLGGPGDSVELTLLNLLTGAPFDLETEEWGLALFHVQVYVDGEGDDVVTGQVKYLTMGDVEIEQADAPAFDENGELIIDADHLAPMQRAYLRTGWDEPICEEIPDPLLLVQSSSDNEPAEGKVFVCHNGKTLEISENALQAHLDHGDTEGTCDGDDGMLVRITVNSAEIELEPNTTILLRNLQPMSGFGPMAAQTMRLIALNGMATVDPDGVSLLVPPGHYVDFCLAAPQDLGLDGQENDQVTSCGPSDPQPLTALDLAELLLLEDIPDNILDDIDVPGIVVRSTVGGSVSFFIFENASVLDAAREACSLGLLPEQICDRLQLPS